jgi:hypothetical protein
MNSNLRYDGHGELIGEYFEFKANELPYETIGMWQMVSAGRLAYGLSGADLDEFLHRFIIVLLGRGAKPVRTIDVKSGVWMWAEQIQYGNTSVEIANSIIADWHSLGSPDPEWDWVRFALPNIVGIPTLDHTAVTPRS